jgi:hypothetical protein
LSSSHSTGLPAPLVGNRRALVAVLMAVSPALSWPDCADSEMA